ncbi:MAG: DNA repair protein RecO [Immundisolibacter sp.]
MAVASTAARAQVLLQPAYLLHRRPYRDSSLLLECFTRDHGRVGLVARGGRGRLAGVLQPFTPLLLSWSGGGDLKTLSQAEPDGYADSLRGAALAAGFYLNELLLRSCARLDPHPLVYTAYARALAALRGTAIEPALRRFERDLLAGLGYGLLLEHDADGAAIAPDGRYHYRPEHGAVPAADGDLVGAALLALQHDTLDDPAHWPALKRLLRSQLRWHFGDRPLKSRALYHALAGPASSESNPT